MSEPLKLCECGCGEKTNISLKTNRKKGHVKGKSFQFIRGHPARINHPMYGKHHSAETCRKISIAQLGENNHNYGKQFSEDYCKKLSMALSDRILSKDHCKNISKAMTGKTLSEETRRKISAAISLIVSGENHPMYGKHHSKESRKKMSESRRKQILPLKDTTIEVKLQNFLKLLGLEFFTHQYVDIEHGYQCDILIPSMNLILEADGDYWHKYPIGKDIDKIRTKELIEKGFKVLRLWESEINTINLEEFKKRLCA